MKTKCVVCGDGYTTKQMELIDFEYKGKVFKIESYYNRCDVCGSEVSSREEVDKELEQIREIKSRFTK